MSRRGFRHFLSNMVPRQKWEADRILDLYRLLRAGYKQHRDEMFLAHLRLGFTKVAFMFSRETEHEKLEEFVSVMCVSLWEGISRLEDGAIDHHRPTPNPTAYLMLKLKGDLRDFSYKDRVIPSYPRQKRIAGRVPLTDRTVGVSEFHPSLPVQELEQLACQSERDSEILSRTIAGENDVEIGRALNLSKTRIGQIKKEMASRIKDYV